MYLIFKSVDAAVPNSHVYGVEFCNSVPTFVTKTSDMVYSDIGDGKTSTVKAKVDQILANIDEVTIKPTVNTVTTCDLLTQVDVAGSSPDRRIDPSDWKTTVKPAWYRVVTYTDHSVI